MIEQNPIVTPVPIIEQQQSGFSEAVSSQSLQTKENTELSLEERIDATASDLAQQVLDARKSKESKLAFDRGLGRERSLLFVLELAERLGPTPTEAAIFKAFEVTILEQHANILTQMAQEKGITEESVEGMDFWEKTDKLQFKRAQEAAATALENFYLEAARSDQPQKFLEIGQEILSTLRRLSNEGASQIILRNKVIDNIRK